MDVKGILWGVGSPGSVSYAGSGGPEVVSLGVGIILPSVVAALTSLDIPSTSTPTRVLFFAQVRVGIEPVVVNPYTFQLYPAAIYCNLVTQSDLAAFRFPVLIPILFDVCEMVLD